MALRIIDIADGYESETVPSVVSIIGLRSSEFFVTVSHLLAGKFTLSIAPGVPSTLTLSLNGITQSHVDGDFEISGPDIIFVGYNMESLITTGDLIRITYQ